MNKEYKEKAASFNKELTEAELIAMDDPRKANEFKHLEGRTLTQMGLPYAVIIKQVWRGFAIGEKVTTSGKMGFSVFTVTKKKQPPQITKAQAEYNEATPTTVSEPPGAVTLAEIPGTGIVVYRDPQTYKIRERNAGYEDFINWIERTKRKTLQEEKSREHAAFIASQLEEYNKAKQKGEQEARKETEQKREELKKLLATAQDKPAAVKSKKALSLASEIAALVIIERAMNQATFYDE